MAYSDGKSDQKRRMRVLCEEWSNFGFWGQKSVELYRTLL